MPQTLLFRAAGGFCCRCFPIPNPIYTIRHCSRIFVHNPIDTQFSLTLLSVWGRLMVNVCSNCCRSHSLSSHKMRIENGLICWPHQSHRLCLLLLSKLLLTVKPLSVWFYSANKLYHRRDAWYEQTMKKKGNGCNNITKTTAGTTQTNIADSDNDSTSNSKKFLMFLDCFQFLFKWL